MLDNKRLRQDPRGVAKALAVRGFQFDVDQFLALDARRKALQVETEHCQNQRNSASKNIGQAKARGEPIEPLLKAVNDLGEKLDNAKQAYEQVQAELDEILMNTPNIPHPDVPAGKDETDNQEVQRFGEPKSFDFNLKSHEELGELRGFLDFASSAKITGSRFAVLHGPLARLHRALIQFMLDTHTSLHGYEETYVPYLVNTESLYGTGQLPKFADDLFKIDSETHPYYLIPTAEVPLTNLARNSIIAADDLPKQYVAHTPCFRSEAGSYGKDVKGMIRQHQFEKVELVWLAHPDNSYEALELLRQHAQTILEKLNLAYRTVILCGGDLGFGATKTYDIEVWMPSQETYREISSCSNTEAFQARRMQARFRDNSESKPEYLHTLNGSGLAIGRTLVAIMENYQTQDGRITIPDALVPYMNGQTEI